MALRPGRIGTRLGAPRGCPACLRVSGLGVTFKVSGLSLGLSSVFRVHGSWFMVQGSSFRVSGSGFFRQGLRSEGVGVACPGTRGSGRGQGNRSNVRT